MARHKAFFLGLFFLCSILFPDFVLGQGQASPGTDTEHWLYVSFKDPGSGGIWFAHSSDGYEWTPLNNDNPWLIPDKQVGNMRDPFIARDPEKGFHMVWTCGNRKIGYAFSEDLVHWSPQRTIPLFADNLEAINTWAPELFYDKADKHWLIYWSTTLKDQFPETFGQVENEKNHRIYYVTTKDFKTFSEPKLLLEPGYPVIDATLFQVGDTYYNIFKDERRWPLHKQLRLCCGPSPLGPWSKPSEPITVPWTEGPSVLCVDDQFLLFYDMYRGGQHMGAVRTRDFKTWEDVTVELSVPDRYKHGGFIPITEDEYKRLLKGNSAKD